MFSVFMFVPIEWANGGRASTFCVMPNAIRQITGYMHQQVGAIVLTSYSSLFVPLTSSSSLPPRSAPPPPTSIQISLHRNFEHDAIVVVVVVGRVLHIR